MTLGNDPAVEQEGAGDGSITVTDPAAVTEDVAESSSDAEGAGGEGAGQEPQKDTKGTPKQEAAQAGGVEITIDGEEPPAVKDTAPEWVKDLRKTNREQAKRIEELERERAQSRPTVLDPGPKPTLAGCGYDEEEFEKKHDEWKAKEEQRQVAEKQHAQQVEASQRDWQGRQDAYVQQRTELAKQIPNYAEAEAVFDSLFDQQQRGVLLYSATNAALVVAALGQNPKLAQDLAAVKNPIQFAAKIGQLEAKLKMKPRTQAPPPEKPVTGTGSKTGSGDSHLEKLRDKAAKTGDNSEVNAYLREQRRKAQR